MKRKLPNILKDFFNYLSLRNYSKNTILTYEKNLYDFLHFIKKYKRIKHSIENFSSIIFLNIKKEEIIAYLTYLNYERNNAYATRKNKLATIKCFYKWLMQFSPNAYNPAKEIPEPLVIEKLPKYLNLEQAQKIQSIFNSQNCKNPLRNNTIIILFLASGLRISELKNIKIKNIDFQNKTIFIEKGKGNKSRTAYFNDYCKKYLLEYINTNNIIDINDFLFNIGIEDIRYICKKAFRLLGVEDKGYTPHTLRHTIASIMYQNTQDILIVKEFLGHKTLQSTEVYVHLNNENLRNAINSNPLNSYICNKIA